MHIPPRWQPMLRVLLLLAIFSMAGPETIPAIEMATLLELLGAMLFITAFGAALRMTAIDAVLWIGSVLAPAPIIAMYRDTRRSLQKVEIALWLSGRAAYLLAMLAPPCLLVKHLAGGHWL